MTDLVLILTLNRLLGHTAASISVMQEPRGHSLVKQTHTTLAVTTEIIVNAQGKGAGRTCACVLLQCADGRGCL